MKKFKKCTLAVCVVLVFLLTACGSSTMYKGTESAVMEAAGVMEAAVPAEDYLYDNGGVEYETEETWEEGDTDSVSGAQIPAQTNKKLIRNVNLDVETHEFDRLTANITARVEQLGGYVENIDVEGVGLERKTTRYGSMTVRVPADKLDGFLESVEEQSNITYRSENVQDVTSQYVDLESHKKALLIEQQRLLEILEKAETVTDIIEIEERLAQVRYEIENMESQLRIIDNKVNYSTVSISIREVEVYTPVEEPGIGERISTGFSENVKNVIRDYRELFIKLVIRIPYLIVPTAFLIIVVVITLIVVKASNKKSVKQAKKQRRQTEQKNVNQENSGQEKSV